MLNLIGGGIFKMHTTAKRVRLYDLNGNPKLGAPTKYESAEKLILETLLKHTTILEQLIDSKILVLENPENIDYYSVNRKFWSSSGPLPNIINNLIETNNQNDAFLIIRQLYESHQFRETDNYKEFVTNLGSSSSKKSKSKSKFREKKTAKELFKDHEDQYKRLKKTLIKCILVSNANSKTTGNFKQWLDKFLIENKDMLNDSGFGRGKTIKARKSRKIRTIRKIRR